MTFRILPPYFSMELSFSDPAPRASLLVLLLLVGGSESGWAQTHNEVGILEPEHDQAQLAVVNVLTGKISVPFGEDIALGPENAASRLVLSRRFVDAYHGMGQDPLEGADTRFGFNIANSLDITWFCSGDRYNNCQGPKEGRQGLLVLGQRTINFNGAYYSDSVDPDRILHSSEGDGTYIKFKGAWSSVTPYFSTTAITGDGTRYLFQEVRNGSVTMTDQGRRDIRIFDYSTYMDNTVGHNVAKVIYANGETLKFFYGVGHSNTFASADPRVERVESSRGYILKVTYLSDRPQGSGSQVRARLRHTKIKQIDAYLKTCASCLETHLGVVKYYYDNSYRLTEFSDLLGQIYRYEYENPYSPSTLTSVTEPDGTLSWRVRSPFGMGGGQDITIGDAGTQLTMQLRHRKDNPGRFATITSEVTYADGATVKYHSKREADSQGLWTESGWTDSAYKTYHPVKVHTFFFEGYNGFDLPPRLVAVEDELGRRKDFEYDRLGRLITIRYPELNMSHFKRDERGNIFERVDRAKPGSGKPDLITKAIFPKCNDTNFRICNKPTYVVDANGYRTDYDWSPKHGGLLSIRSGYDEAGACILVGACTLIEHDYSPFAGVDGAVFYLRTETKQRIDTESEIRTTFTYHADKGFALREKVEFADGKSLRTCYSYDELGRRISETQPKAGLASCP